MLFMILEMYILIMFIFLHSSSDRSPSSRHKKEQVRFIHKRCILLKSFSVNSER